MRKPLFCFVVAVTCLAGCGRQEDVRQLKAINQTLQNANKAIQEDIDLVQETLMEKRRDPVYYSYGEIWEPKASRIHKKADSIVAFIEELKRELIKQSDSLKKEEAVLIAQLHSTNGPGYKLLNKLTDLKNSFQLIIDPINRFGLTKEVGHLNSIVPLLPAYSDSLNANQRKHYAKNWVEDNFSASSAPMAMAVLNRIENDLMVTTRAFMKFCLQQMPVLTCGLRLFRGVATLSSSYVKQGQPIEVTAGIGDFSAISNPRITIGGKEIKLDHDAVAVHHFIAGGKPGKHSVRVEIEYTKLDGSNEHVYKDLTYIIADEK